MLNERCSMWQEFNFLLLRWLFYVQYIMDTFSCVPFDVCIECGEFRRLAIISNLSLLLLVSLLTTILDKRGLNCLFILGSHFKCLQLDKATVSTGFKISC
jgi:hypothetical protein